MAKFERAEIGSICLVQEASDVLNISQSYLSQQLNGKRRNKTKLMYL